MSVAELLPAIRALPRAERVQLLHLLVDDMAKPELAPAEDVLPKELGDLVTQPGFVAEVWFPEANPEGVAAALRALNEAGGVTNE